MYMPGYIMLPDWTPVHFQYLILLIFPIIRISQRSKHLSQYYNNTAKKNLFVMESSFQHQFTYLNPYTDVIWTKLNFWTCCCLNLFLSLPISIAFLSFSFSFTFFLAHLHSAVDSFFFSSVAYFLPSYVRTFR